MCLLKEQIRYHGYVVDKEGLCPQNSKLEAVQKMTSPSLELHIQVSLSTVGYYWRFYQEFRYYS